MLGATKIGKNRETTWIFEKGNCKPIGKDRETISNNFFFGKRRETTSVFESGNCKPVGKERETSWGKNCRIFFFGKSRETTLILERGNCKPIGKHRETDLKNKNLENFWRKTGKRLGIYAYFPPGKTGKVKAEWGFRGVFPGRTPPHIMIFTTCVI